MYRRQFPVTTARGWPGGIRPASACIAIVFWRRSFASFTRVSATAALLGVHPPPAQPENAGAVSGSASPARSVTTSRRRETAALKPGELERHWRRGFAYNDGVGRSTWVGSPPLQRCRGEKKIAQQRNVFTVKRLQVVSVATPAYCRWRGLGDVSLRAVFADVQASKLSGEIAPERGGFGAFALVFSNALLVMTRSPTDGSRNLRPLL